MAHGNTRNGHPSAQGETFDDLQAAANKLYNISFTDAQTAVSNCSGLNTDAWGGLATTSSSHADMNAPMDTGYEMSKEQLAQVLGQTSLASMVGLPSDDMLDALNNSNFCFSDIITASDDGPLAFLNYHPSQSFASQENQSFACPENNEKLYSDPGLADAVILPTMITVTESPDGSVAVNTSFNQHSTLPQTAQAESGPSSPDCYNSSHSESKNSFVRQTRETHKRKKRTYHRANVPPESPCRTPTERSPTHTPPNSPLTRSPAHSGPNTPTHSPHGSYDNLFLKEEGKGSEKVPRHKRPAHMRAETKRRDKIQQGMHELQEMVPKLRSAKDQGARDSKANVLQRTMEHIRQLRSETKTQTRELKQLSEDISQLSTDIDTVQEALPTAGIGSEQQPPTLQKLMLDHRTRWLDQDWRYGIFLMLTHTMKEGYPLRMENVQTFQDFEQELSNWLLQEGSLAPIRSSAKRTLRSLSTETSIMVNPEKLPQEIRDLIKRKRAEAEKNQGADL